MQLFTTLGPSAGFHKLSVFSFLNVFFAPGFAPSAPSDFEAEPLNKRFTIQRYFQNKCFDLTPSRHFSYWSLCLLQQNWASIAAQLDKYFSFLNILLLSLFQIFLSSTLVFGYMTAILRPRCISQRPGQPDSQKYGLGTNASYESMHCTVYCLSTNCSNNNKKRD